MFKPAIIVHVTIISCSDNLYDSISSVVTDDDDCLEIQSVADPGDVSPHADILVFCGDPASLPSLRASNPNTILIWYTDAESFSTMSACDLVDDLWVAPMSEKECHCRLRIAVKHLRRRQSNAFYEAAMHAAINNIPDLVWFKDMEGTHLKVNDAFCECVDKPKQDVEGHDHFHIWGLSEEEYKNSDYVCVDTDVIVKENKKSGVFDELVMSARGLRQFKTYKSPIINDAGVMIGTIGIARDITDLRNIDNKLRIVLDSMPFALLVTDENNHVIHTNPKFEYIFTVSSNAILSHPIEISDLVHVLSREPIKDGTEEELRIRLRDGRVLTIVIQQSNILDIFGNFVGNLTIFMDVTHSREIESKLMDLAYTDSLTGLYSRHYLFHTLENSSDIGPITLLLIDLDNFKQVNDNYGHEAGDRLLQKVGHTMREAFPDDMVVRVGGDEFLVVRFGLDDINVFLDMSKSLIKRLKQEFHAEECSREVSSSGGVAFTPGLSFDENFDDLLRKGDRALYRAKKQGKDRVEVY